MIEVFNYNDNPVSFYKKEGVVYMNATEMAKPFGRNKRAQFYLNNASTKEFMEELSKARNLALDDLVQISHGGERPGTWLHEDLALDFSQWLSAAFRLWCNDRIKELLQKGVTRLEDISRKQLAQMLLDAEIEKERLQIQNKLQAKELKEAAPKLDYYENVIQSEEAIRTTVIAKDLGMSAKKLNRLLYLMGVQYKVGKTWVLYAKYADKGYTVSLTHPYTGSDGSIKTRIQTCWTQKGREFVMKAVEAYRSRPLTILN